MMRWKITAIIDVGWKYWWSEFSCCFVPSSTKFYEIQCERIYDIAKDGCKQRMNFLVAHSSNAYQIGDVISMQLEKE